MKINHLAENLQGVMQTMLQSDILLLGN